MAVKRKTIRKGYAKAGQACAAKSGPAASAADALMAMVPERDRDPTRVDGWTERPAALREYVRRMRIVDCDCVSVRAACTGCGCVYEAAWHALDMVSCLRIYAPADNCPRCGRHPHFRALADHEVARRLDTLSERKRMAGLLQSLASAGAAEAKAIHASHARTWCGLMLFASELCGAAALRALVKAEARRKGVPAAEVAQQCMPRACSLNPNAEALSALVELGASAFEVVKDPDAPADRAVITSPLALCAGYSERHPGPWSTARQDAIVEAMHKSMKGRQA